MRGNGFGLETQMKNATCNMKNATCNMKNAT
jgi:hypothetical protein